MERFSLDVAPKSDLFVFQVLVYGSTVFEQRCADEEQDVEENSVDDEFL